MKVHGWTGDRGGCGFYRIEEPLRGLALRGHETVLHRPSLPPHGAVPDVLVSQRLHTPGTYGVWQGLRNSGKLALIADFDDDLWRVPRQSPAHVVYGREDVQKHLREYARASHVITVSTPTLAERVAAELRPGGHVPPILVIPNTIPAALIEAGRAAQGPFVVRERRAARTVVGWAGSSTHEHDWRMARPVVQGWLKVNRDKAIGHCVGVDYLNAELFTPWLSSMDDYYRTILGFDIGLAPLSPTHLNNSKSHIKVLEYMAAGVLPIASDEPPYRQLLGDDGGWGYLAQRPGDWSDALTYTGTLRPEAWGAVRELNWRVASTYTTESNSHLWEDAIKFARDLM